MIEQFMDKAAREFAKLSEVPLYVWLILAPVLIVQGTWLFLDARKRGANRWFWGLWGMINTPTPLILYLIFIRKIHSGKKVDRP